MTKTFSYFTLAQIYEYAEKMGFAQKDVEISKETFLDGSAEYVVSFGHEYTEQWIWTFEESLDGQSVDYEHELWED